MNFVQCPVQEQSQMKIDYSDDTPFQRNNSDVKFSQEQYTDISFFQTKTILAQEEIQKFNFSNQNHCIFQSSDRDIILDQKQAEESLSKMFFNASHYVELQNPQPDQQYFENEGLCFQSQIHLNDNSDDNLQEPFNYFEPMCYDQQYHQCDAQEENSSSPLNQSETSQIPQIQSQQSTSQESSNKLVDEINPTNAPKKYYQDHLYKGVFQRICVLINYKPQKKNYKSFLVEKIVKAIKDDDHENSMIYQIAQTYNKKKCEYFINFILNLLKNCQNYIDTEHPSVVRAVKSLYNSIILKLMKL